jgi:hypothetical protein
MNCFKTDTCYYAPTCNHKDAGEFCSLLRENIKNYKTGSAAKCEVNHKGGEEMQSMKFSVIHIKHGKQQARIPLCK